MTSLSNQRQPMLFAEQLKKMSDGDLRALHEGNLTWDRHGPKRWKNAILTDEECSLVLAEYERRKPEWNKQQDEEWARQRKHNAEIKQRQQQMWEHIRAATDDELTRMDRTVTTTAELTAIRMELARRDKTRRAAARAAHRAASPTRGMAHEELLAWDETGMSVQEIEEVRMEIRRRIQQLEAKARRLKHAPDTRTVKSRTPPLLAEKEE